MTDPEVDLLSEIIERVNQTHGINLTEDDKISLGQLKEQLSKDSDVRLFMRGDSSDLNKQEFFKKEFDRKLLGQVNDRLDFYKRMNENPAVKELICIEFFKDCQKSQESMEERRTA